MMPAPFYSRHHIPFFYDKSPAEFQQDPYERYEEMVVRQTALHLADQLWEHYPFQVALDFAKDLLPINSTARILEIGCGVGRWVGSIAQQYPQANCWGIDYSYQMLKRAREYWISGKSLEIDLRSRGFVGPFITEGHQLENLQLGLAKAEQLPFADQSQDLVLSSFLIDRLEDPLSGLREMQRVLVPSGKMVLVTPLNFQRTQHWQNFYPASKLLKQLRQLGFSIDQQQEVLNIKEPLDIHGNDIHWKCLALIAEKLDL